MKVFVFASIISALFLASQAFASIQTIFFVSPIGNDSNAGNQVNNNTVLVMLVF